MPMRIGIVCYASVGGSGIIATELGKTLAARGHDVHILSSDTPFRLGGYQPGLTFHRVETPALSAVSRAAVPVVAREQDRPGGAARAARHRPRALRDPARDGGVSGAADSGARPLHGRVPAVITTLHGTDITLLGSDRSYSETVAFCIEQSDGVTAVSESLKADTCRELAVTTDIRVIPNFLNCAVHHRVEASAVRARLIGDEPAKIAIHVSNFRPVKRVHGGRRDVRAHLPQRAQRTC